MHHQAACRGRGVGARGELCRPCWQRAARLAAGGGRQAAGGGGGALDDVCIGGCMLLL